MGLFSSKFAKLEAFVTAKSDERTPDMLKAAQAELDAAGAKLVLVPHSEGITSGAELDSYIEGLKAAATTAKAEAEKAATALAELKGKRVLDTARVTSDAGKEGDDQGTETAEQKEVKEAQARVQELPHYKRVHNILNQE
jgi:hypothetical protein